MKKTVRDFLNQHYTINDVVLEESGYRLTELEYLSPDSLQKVPDGSFYAKGQWYKQAEINENSFDIQSTVDFLVEGVSGEQYGLSKFRGGIIVFSTDVNAVGAAGSGIKGRVKSFVTNTFDTFKNRVLKNKKLSALVQKHNLANDDDLFIGAFSIGKFFTGRYIGNNGGVYNEKSTTIEILGVPSEVLLLLGTEIAKEFKQETVLIKDLNKNRFYLADRSDVDDVSKEVKKI